MIKIKKKYILFILLLFLLSINFAKDVKIINDDTKIFKNYSDEDATGLLQKNTTVKLADIKKDRIKAIVNCWIYEPSVENNKVITDEENIRLAPLPTTLGGPKIGTVYRNTEFTKVKKLYNKFNIDIECWIDIHNTDLQSNINPLTIVRDENSPVSGYVLSSEPVYKITTNDNWILIKTSYNNIGWIKENKINAYNINNISNISAKEYISKTQNLVKAFLTDNIPGNIADNKIFQKTYLSSLYFKSLFKYLKEKLNLIQFNISHFKGDSKINFSEIGVDMPLYYYKKVPGNCNLKTDKNAYVYSVNKTHKYTFLPNTKINIVNTDKLVLENGSIFVESSGKNTIVIDSVLVSGNNYSMLIKRIKNKLIINTLRGQITIVKDTFTKSIPENQTLKCKDINDIEKLITNNLSNETKLKIFTDYNDINKLVVKENKTLAIFEFQNISVDKHKSEGKIIYNDIVAHLKKQITNNNYATLVDRNQMDKIVKENQMAISGISNNADTFIKNVKYIPAEYIITGKYSYDGEKINISLQLINSYNSEIVYTDNLKYSKNAVIFIIDKSLIHKLDYYLSGKHYLFDKNDFFEQYSINNITQVSDENWQENYEKTEGLYELVIENFPNSKHLDDYYYRLAYINMKFKDNYRKSLKYFEKIRWYYHNSEYIDDALYYSGLIYEEQIKDNFAALNMYENLITQYQDSEFVDLIQSKYESLKKIIQYSANNLQTYPQPKLFKVKKTQENINGISYKYQTVFFFTALDNPSISLDNLIHNDLNLILDMPLVTTISIIQQKMSTRFNRKSAQILLNLDVRYPLKTNELINVIMKKVFNFKDNSSYIPDNDDSLLPQIHMKLYLNYEMNNNMVIKKFILCNNFSKKYFKKLIPIISNSVEREGLTISKIKRTKDEVKKLDYDIANIIWVVDNSGSMMDEQKSIAENANTFIKLLNNIGCNWRIAIATTDTSSPYQNYWIKDPDEFKEKIIVGINGSGNEKGLKYGKETIEQHRNYIDTDNKTFMIFVSDEPDNTKEYKTDELINFFQTNNITCYSIINANKFEKDYAEKYIKVSNNTNGHYGSIHTTSRLKQDVMDWSPVLNVIAEDIAAQTRGIIFEHRPILNTLSYNNNDIENILERENVLINEYSFTTPEFEQVNQYEYEYFEQNN